MTDFHDSQEYSIYDVQWQDNVWNIIDENLYECVLLHRVSLSQHNTQKYNGLWTYINVITAQNMEDDGQSQSQ